MSNNKRFIRFLPIFGCISTGVVYTGIGIIAILSLLRLKNGGASANSMMAVLKNFTGGTFVIGAILLGMLSYITWRLYECVKDPYNYGKTWKGLTRRTGIALSSFADAFIGYSALIVLLGSRHVNENGNPEHEREMIGNMLHAGGGNELIIGLGIAILVTAGVQFFYGITRGYRERLDIANISYSKKKTIFILGMAGYIARGIIIGIMGYFIIKAGITHNAEYAVNTDKAFDFIGDNVGKIPFAIVALGTIFYGIFMFAMGITYDVDNDPSDPHYGNA